MAAVNADDVLVRLNSELERKYTNLKPKQIETINASLANDVIATLPTGINL